jgi:hypothetical protein
LKYKTGAALIISGQHLRFFVLLGFSRFCLGGTNFG